MRRHLKVVALFFSLVLIISGCGAVDEEVGSISGENPKAKVETEQNVDSDINDKIISYYFELTGKLEDTKIQGKYWYQGSDYRIETTNFRTGQDSITFYSTEDKALYKYHPTMNTATKIPMEPNLNSKGAMIDLERLVFDSEIEGEFLKFEEIIYNGNEVYYIESAEASFDQEGEFLSKLWISKEYGLPLKTENYNSGKLVYYSEITNIQEGPFDAALFRVPEGVAVEGL